MLKRKHISILLIVISVAFVIMVAKTQKPQEGYSSTDSLYISESDFNALSSSSNISQVPLTTEIYFNDEKLLYDDVDNTFYYSVLEGSDKGLSPEVTITGEGIKLVLYGNQMSYEQIASNTPLQLILIQGSNVSITNLICTTLPIMNVEIGQDIIDSQGLDLTYDIETDAASSIYLYDNSSDFDGPSRTIVSDSKIRKRGQTNSTNPAKGYRLTLLKDKNDFNGERVKEDLLGLRKDDDWILYNGYRDYEKVRNVFSMNLWHDTFYKDNEWKVSNSTEYKFLELFINNHYHGLYALCYPLDKKEFDLKEDEALFKKMDWTHSERNTELEYQEYYDGSGGDYVLPGYAVKAGDIEDFQTLLNLYVNMTYSTYPEVIRMSSDVTNGIDLWLYYKVSEAVDNVANGGAKNMYVCIKDSKSGIEGKKLLITPWDMDQSWRHVYEGSSGGQYSSSTYDMPVEWGLVYSLQGIDDPQINSDIKARYRYLRENVWSNENILAALDGYEDDIYNSGAFARTQARWPEGLYNDRRLGLSEFRDYVIKRFEYMDSYIAGL
ncbi:CotH protein [Pseudobutyrivibrio sp. 49]|uniref:CotH kinase family protein n=1 Tax=Pseudobutyrivibrio sp. 49 TaxID=1855344 RepID=UPI0008905FC3|nr:CotH kinase family protein [Pseudobutyrivibrio sp. 49]SDH57475.1 CotH protein [Pseudobutyrivibrio sp. 49]